MITFSNQTKNQKIIHALIKGQVVQYKEKTENHWIDYDVNYYIENNDAYGPWNCNDLYEWRIKPNTVTKILPISIRLEFTFEGVKPDHYKEGEDIFYIWRSISGNFHKKTIKNVNHSNERDVVDHIFFETEEAMDKAYEQILNATKGLQ